MGLRLMALLAALPRFLGPLIPSSLWLRFPTRPGIADGGTPQPPHTVY